MEFGNGKGAGVVNTLCNDMDPSFPGTYLPLLHSPYIHINRFYSSLDRFSNVSEGMQMMAM
jgi:hypothetical protein